MVYPDTFTGFQIDGPESWTDFKKRDYQPKPFGDYDVDVKIHACGICGSDLHTISGGVCSNNQFNNSYFADSNS